MLFFYGETIEGSGGVVRSRSGDADSGNPIWIPRPLHPPHKQLSPGRLVVDDRRGDSVFPAAPFPLPEKKLWGFE